MELYVDEFPSIYLYLFVKGFTESYIVRVF